MSYESRLPLIAEIEKIRSSKMICYLTSVRANAGAQIAEDQVRVFFDHLLELDEPPIERLDIFLCSNGGNGVVPWRLISLLREYAKFIGVLIPYRAYSAATMLALGADEIVMHPFAEMGPIDPTVSNDFNPIDPQTQQKVGISVEDVKAYISFVKDTVGIRHEDELIKAIQILAEKVHPLALGNVERFISQNRMITRKILLTHMDENKSRHDIDETIETLASKLYFHGHPINRKEAKDEMGLKVMSPVPKRLETLMWQLYLDFEDLLKNKEPFDPMAAIFSQTPVPIVGQIPMIQPGIFTQFLDTLALVESGHLSSTFEIERRFVVVGANPDPVIRAETLAQGWQQARAPARPPTEPAPGRVRKGSTKSKGSLGAP